MLPQCESEFYRELEAWHPDLIAFAERTYLSTGRYPRCWIVAASITFATAYPEYARVLLRLLADADLVGDSDAGNAEICAEKVLAGLNTNAPRLAVCHATSVLYRDGSRSLTRAFAAGLNFAFLHPEAARSVLDLLNAEDRRKYDWQVAAAGLVVHLNPIQAQS